MSWQETPYSFPLAVASVLAALTAVHMWRWEWVHRRNPGGQTATLFLVAAAIWGAAYVMELASSDLPSKLFWSKLEYFGIVTIPSTWLVFALRYTGREKPLTPWFFPLVNLIPTVTLVLALTNESHGLIWSQVALDTSLSFTVLRVSHGAWFWVNLLYTYVLAAVVVVLLIHMMFRSMSLYRWQVRSMLLAGVVPWLANLIYVLGLDPFPGLDLTPISVLAAGLIIAWSMSELRRDDIMAVSRGTVLQIMSDGVLVLDGQDRIVYANPAAEQLLEVSASKVTGQPVREVWPEWLESTQPDGSPELAREMTLTAEGQERAYDIRVSPHLDWRGHLVGSVVVVRDVSDRRKVEKRRERYIKDLAFLSKTAIDMVELSPEEDIYRFIADRLRTLLDGPFIMVNSLDGSPAALVVRAIAGLGRQAETVTRMLHMDPLGSRFPVAGDADSMLRSGKLVDVSDGLYGLSFGQIPRPVCGAIESLLRIGSIHAMGFVRQGELLGNIVVLMRKGAELHNREIVETFANLASVALQRKRAEEALRESEERFRRLSDNAQDIIFRIDLVPSPRFTYVSPAVRMLGYPPEELYADPELIFKAVSPEDAHLLEEMERGIVRSEPVAVRWVRRDGGTVWTELRNVAIADEAGNVVAIEGIARDVSQNRFLEERLLRAQRLEVAGTVAGQVAHDFNNLLGPLTVYPDLIRMSLPEDHETREYCDNMLEAAAQMAAINEDMMALGRRGHFAQQPVNLNPLVEQSVQRLPDKPDSLIVCLDLSEELTPVLGSSAQLQRVIFNLLTNAHEAVKDGGRVAVRTENVSRESAFGSFNPIPAGEYVRLAVSDTGCGIPDGIRDKIFDAFFTTKSKAPRWGCGLGLSVVQAIVEDHKAFLDLESEVGKGTTFSIYFPPHKEAPKVEAPEETPGGQSETILVVDDDRFQREVVRELLKALGYRADAVSSGEEAVAYVEQRPVHLMILDMVMPPGIDGVETYRRVKEVRPDQRAIIVSGFAESEAVGTVQRLGAGAFLRKPVTRDKLGRAVREALEG